MTPAAEAAATRDHEIRPNALTRPRTGARRVSGPARPAMAGGGAVVAPPLRVRPPARSPSGPSPVAPSLAEAVARLCDSRVLDRLVRGRFWIGFVAFALIGIVAMQLALLKLNTGIGRAIERESLLARQNADLEAEVSGMAAVDRLQSQAAAFGMVTAAPGSARFLTAGGAATARAAAALDAAWGSASILNGSANATSATNATATAARTVPVQAGASLPGSSAVTLPSSASASSTTAAASTPTAAPPAAAQGAGTPSSATGSTNAATPPANPGSSPGVSSPPTSGVSGGGTSAPVGG